MKWDLTGNRLSFADDKTTLFAVKNLRGRVQLDGEMTFADDCQNSGISWQWEVREKDGGLSVKAILENRSSEMIKIGNWDVIYSQDDQVDLGDRVEDLLFFRWKRWDIVVFDFLADRDLTSATLSLMTDKKSRHTLQIAFATVDRMMVSHEFKIADRHIAEMYARCEACDFRLQPGDKLESEELIIKYYSDPYTALEDWADGIYQHYQPCFDGTMQAVFSYSTAGKREFGEILPHLAENVEKYFGNFGKQMLTGGTHVIIKGGLPGHWLEFEENKNGLPYPELLKEYHKKGYTFKFWFSPFWFFGEAEETLKENFDNLLKDKDGNPIHYPFLSGWELGRGKYGKDPLNKYFLDGTHPGTKKYLRKVFTAYREIGCRAYMLDFLSSVPGAERYDETILPLQASRAILKEIRSAAGNDTHIQTAVASLPAFVGCINSARVVRDYGEGRPQHPFPNWRNATHCRHDDHFANYHSFVQNAAAAYFTNYKVYVNDLNALLLDHPVPANQARINVTMFGLSGDSPVSVADNLDKMVPERMRMLKMCFPRTGGIPKPVDLFDRTTAEGGCHILKKAIKTDYDEYMLAAVFNTAPDAPEMYSTRVDLAKLGLDPEKEYRIYEFWNGEYYGTYKGSFPCAVPAADCRLFRISEVRNHPWLIGTDMHVEQGNCEVKNLKYDENTLTLSGVTCRPAGEYGRLVFLMPRNLKVDPEYANDLNTMKEVIDMQTVISLNIKFEKDEMPFAIRFEQMDTDFVARPDWLPYARESEWLKYISEHRSDYDPCRVIK